MWIPDLTGRGGPRYAAIADAIVQAVRAGVLAAGERLPAQREVARQLGVNLTTVTRAYALAAEMGVVSGEIGRGTYVRLLPDSGRMPWPSEGERDAVDLSSNFPYPAAGAEELAQALDDLRGGRRAADLLRYQPAGASPSHLAAGRAWLAALGMDVPADSLLLTSGAIHAVFLCLLALTRPGDRILVEELTSPALIGACNALGLRAEGLTLDAEGIRPAALDAALRREKARAVVLVANLQNPTLSVMSADRRRDIAEVVRRHQSMIIEDDAYGALLPAEQRPPPVATFAPERSCYATSLSKAVAPGLRIGFLKTPPALRGAVQSALRINTWMISPLLGHIASRWITDGTAANLAVRQRAAAGHRQQLAAEALRGFDLRGHPCALHVWLRLPEPWRADEFTAYLQERGVTVLSSGLMVVDTGLRPAAIRVSLCNVESEDRLRHGLTMVADVLNGRA
jgi:DNA-binding transcriptional MocR family regulator